MSRINNLGLYAKKGAIPWNTGLGKQDKVVCIVCSTKFGVTPNRRDRAKYCSQKCYHKNCIGKKGHKLFGDKNPAWKGGITAENLKIRTSEEYLAWRNFVFKRDDYTCQICGERGGNLRANHIKRFSDYPEERMNKKNGITICKDCDYRWVFFREKDWESYFNFNLQTRELCL